LKRPTLLIVFLIVFVDLLGFGLIIPILPFYAKTLGAGPATYGVLLGIYSLMQFFFNPWWGRLSDRIGRRPVVLVSVAGSVLGFLLFGLAKSILMLFVARILGGIMNSNIAAAQAMIADITPGEGRAKSQGLLGAAFGLGFVFGPAAGGLLSRYGVGVPAFAAAGLAALNFFLALTLLPETNPKHQRMERPSIPFLSVLAKPEVGALVMVYFLTNFAQVTATTVLPLFLLDHLHVLPAKAGEMTGYLLALVGVLLVITQGGLIRPLLKVVREGWLIAAGSLLMLASVALVPFSSTLMLLGAALGLLAVGNGLAIPSITGLISRLTDSHEQGAVLGTNQSMASLARVLGPIFGGFVYSRWGQKAPFLAGGAALAIALFLSLNTLRPVAAALPD
jgi:MFS family permease